MNAIPISRLNVGDQVSMTRAFSEEDVQAFARVTGDSNPAHLDEGYAQGTLFKTRIVHGMLTASLFSALLGTKLPGLGTIYLGQTLQFRKPVYFSEPITATLTVRDIIPEKNRVVLDCLAVNGKGETIITGEAVVLPPVIAKEAD